ncbi:MAG: nucleoside phosphorylase [Bacteroidota bacterium]
MDQNYIPDSELVLNDDGSVYHLHLKPEHIADTVILVGDQGRVNLISSLFDHVEHKIKNREFITHTGIYKGTRITVLSTGIGTDNIDIVVNELDAAVNIDLEKRIPFPKRKKLNLIRIGTSGSIQYDVPVGAHLVSEYALGLDGLLYYYNYEFTREEAALCDRINDHLNWNSDLSRPYIVKGSERLVSHLGEGMSKGVTITASGFYGPQGRALYLKPKDETLNERMESFDDGQHKITNFEMETSALYGLGKMLGHNCCTCCAIIANRVRKGYSEDYKVIVKDLIKVVLDRIVTLPPA